MRFYAIFLILGLFSSTIWADNPPVINQNVTVVPNAKPSECPRNYGGQTDPAQIENDSRYGQFQMNNPGVRSCSGCAINPRSGDCVCATCYDYFN